MKGGYDVAESEVSAAVSAGKQGKTLLLKRRYRLLASGLFLWWLFALISGDVFPFADYGPTCAIVVRVCILVGCIAALAVFAKWRDGLKPWVMRVTAIAATVASFILGTGQMMVMLPFVLYLAGVVAGGCAACFLLGWASLYAKYHLENITVIALESVVIGAFLLWLETLIPDAGFRGLPMVLVPLVHLGFFYSINPSEISSKKMAETLPRFNKVCLYTPPVHGFSYGILAGIGLAGSTHVILPFIGTQALVVALAFVVFAALATIVLHQLQFNILHRPVIVLLIPMIIMAMFVLADDRWYPDYWIL
ncbi:MAG: hypothetical protein IKF96_07500, partial [Eggerthellaceae bacterium]|nr:hypothetical protein [Eggerthellaceae bacterium]